MKIQSMLGIISCDRREIFVYQKLKKVGPHELNFNTKSSVMSINTRKRRIEEKLEGPKAPERRAKKHAREPSTEDFEAEPPAKKRKLNNSDSVEITKVVPAKEKPVVNVDAGEVVMAKRSDEAGAAVARKTYIVDSFDELPEDLRRKVIKSEIAETDADKFFAYVINILHFKTKHNFYTTEQYKNRHKPQQRRYNNGPSKVSDSIVSVNALEAEAEELLAKDFKKRNYKFVIQIGKGGFGRVFMVKSVKDKGKIAVKRIPHVTSKQQRKNFQEMRFLQYAKHPNIIKYLRAYLVGDEIWLMTEYMQGGTLTQAVAVHKFEEDQIAYICQQILFALDFLHDNQLMHRDLKSANIMLDFNDGSVKLIDFGLCSDVSQGEVVHMVGSPFWMPPEMIRRDPHGLPVDIWSLGVCLMELANGHPPNRKSSIKAMFVAVTDGYTEPFEDPKRFSNEFKDFMSHCLQIVPAQRWTVKQLLAHPWLKRAASKEDMERLFRNIFVANKLKFNGL